MRVLHGLLPPSPLDRRAPTARTDGTSSVGRDGARGRGDGAVVRRRAERTSLSPASYSASFPLISAYRFGVRLHARGCCGFRFRLCGAAQRYPLLSWTAPSAPRSSSSATHEEWRLPAAQCSGVPLHGRRRRGLGAAHSSADSPRAQTAHPLQFWAFTSASASTSDRIIRRSPCHAAQCSAVSPSLCTARPG